LTDDITSQIMEDTIRIEEKIIETRRQIHSSPELSNMEFQTSKLVARQLEKLGLEVRTKVGGGTGVMGILRGSGKGKGNVVALRADMDALPVKEESEVPFKSKNEGVMHACGHDTHVAMLLGAAEVLSKHTGDFNGTVKFFFQPAEEQGGRGGAKPMIEDGAMLNPKVDYVFGLHISSPYPSGTFALRPGPLMAAPDGFKITIKGKGGHGAEPENTIDPIFVSSQVISAIQGIANRMINPVEPFVISVCSIHSGTKNNIIPDNAVLEGTIRTLDEKTRTRAKKLLREITQSVCRTFGASCSVEFIEDAYPVTVNDPVVTKEVMEVLRQIKGTKTEETEVILGGEDFSRFLQAAPGTYYFLGTVSKKKGCIYPNHSSKFKVDEDVLKFGTMSLAILAVHFANK
jgi:carboxypeptidase Ss1